MTQFLQLVSEVSLLCKQYHKSREEEQQLVNNMIKQVNTNLYNTILLGGIVKKGIMKSISIRVLGVTWNLISGLEQLGGGGGGEAVRRHREEVEGRMVKVMEERVEVGICPPGGKRAVGGEGVKGMMKEFGVMWRVLGSILPRRVKASIFEKIVDYIVFKIDSNPLNHNTNPNTDVNSANKDTAYRITNEDKEFIVLQVNAICSPSNNQIQQNQIQNQNQNSASSASASSSSSPSTTNIAVVTNDEVNDDNNSNSNNNNSNSNNNNNNNEDDDIIILTSILNKINKLLI